MKNQCLEVGNDDDPGFFVRLVGSAVIEHDLVLEPDDD